MEAMSSRILAACSRLSQSSLSWRVCFAPQSNFSVESRQSHHPLEKHGQAGDPVKSEAHRYGKQVLLTREFIGKSLYNRQSGYFSTKDVINDLPGPLDFSGMLGEWHYRVAVKQAYDSKLSAWMTPVELFSPHFSHALARYIAQEVSRYPTASSSAGPRNKLHLQRTPGRHASTGQNAGMQADGLVVYEVGGGTGTNAFHVLNWLRREHPDLYERTEYTTVEISERLAEQQRRRVGSAHENFRVLNADFMEWGMAGEIDDRQCFFIGMEVLDNLPHDKIAWARPSVPSEVGTRGTGSNQSLYGSGGFLEDGEEKLCEAVVVQTAHGYQEEYRALRDPLIRELVEICPELALMVMPSRLQLGTTPDSGGAAGAWGGAIRETLGGLFGKNPPRPDLRAAFVPTGSLRLMHALRRRLPRHRVILADFDSFLALDGGTSTVREGAPHKPGGALLALNAPIVSSRDPVSGAVTDHDSYMVPLGSADIFFPTCFKRLSRLHAMVCREQPGDGDLDRTGQRGGMVLKQGEFLREHGDVTATRTLTGFNPLLEDYRNASVFLSD